LLTALTSCEAKPALSSADPYAKTVKVLLRCSRLTRQGDDVRGAPLTRAELERLALLSEYTLDNAHFYCETADITRPFPSGAPVSSPSWEFVWNNWLGAALRSEGLGGMCPPLLQVGLRYEGSV